MSIRTDSNARRMLLIAACIAVCGGCGEELPSAPAEEGPGHTVGQYTLELTREQDIVWENDSVHFTVTSEIPLPEGCAYRWDLRSGRIIRQENNTIVAVFECESLMYDGSVRVHVVCGEDKDIRFADAYMQFEIRRQTGILRILPDSAVWDSGRSISLTLEYEGVIPDDAIARWEFGDGAKGAYDPSKSVTHVYETPGEYSISAELRTTSPDSIVASAYSRISITSPTPGRYILVEIAGLERRFDVLHAYVKKNVPMPPDTLAERIRTQHDGMLTWDGDSFQLVSEVPEYSSSPQYSIADCRGSINGGFLDSLRLRMVMTTGMRRHNIELFLTGLPAAPGSQGKWEVRDRTACSQAMVSYAESGREELPFRDYVEVYTLRETTFRADCSFSVTIGHERR